MISQELLLNKIAIAKLRQEAISFKVCPDCGEGLEDVVGGIPEWPKMIRNYCSACKEPKS